MSCPIRFGESAMSQFNEWLAPFAADARLIEDGHELLFVLTTKLASALNDGSSREKVGGILKELIEGMKTHFEIEDEIMERTKYPDSTGHAARHREILGRLEEIDKHLAAGQEIRNEEVSSSLRDDLMNHLLDEDRKYAKHISEIMEKLALL